MVGRLLPHKRIARSLVTILALAFIQLFGFPTSPTLLPSAEAAITVGTITNGTSIGGTGGGGGTAPDCSNAAISSIGVSSAVASGLYITAFSYTCKAFSQDASVSGASTTTTYTPLGTPTVTDSCAANQVGIGLKGTYSYNGSNYYVAGIGLICGNPMSQGSQDSRTIYPTGQSVTSGSAYSYTCPAGNVLMGISIMQGSGVDRITPRCATFTGFTYASIPAPTVASTGIRTASIAFTTLSSNYADTALTYTVSAVPTSGSTITATGSSSPITISGLTSSMAYTVSVTASNTYGNAASAASLALPATVLPGGETDTALTLNGSTQWVTSGLNSTGHIANAITVQAWVNPTNVTAGVFQMIVNKENEYEIGISSTGAWAYGIQGTGGTWSGVATGVYAVNNEWHFVALTRDTNTNVVNFYLDGNLIYVGTADGAGTGAINTVGQPLTIGARTTDGTTFNGRFVGQIDHVAIYNVARTQTQIQSDMNTYIDPTTSGLQIYYDFNEGSGATLYNRATGGTSATDLAIAGSPTWTDVKTVTIDSVYTTVKFPRTYLNTTGGWKSPAQTTRATVLVVGGGGGGGGGLNGGGGGAGGFIETVTSLTPATFYSVTVGSGGAGYIDTAKISSIPSNGRNSVAFNLTANGGGYGAVEMYSPNSHYAANSGGSGGGGSWGNNSANYTGRSGTAGQGFKGGDSGSFSNTYAGAGGGGAGSVGGNVSVGNGGNGGSGAYSNILATTIAGGGGGACRNGSSTSCTAGTATSGGGNAASGNGGVNSTAGAKSGIANTGGGGGGGVIQNTNADGLGGYGGSGIVAVRWINALKPTYTKPTNQYLDVGQVESFSVNMQADSATAILTRTFKWESSTTGVNGTFSVIKQGTGINNTFFAWYPPDTTTSGSNYIYRLTVTDSDTAGLYISDSSTAYAIINKAMVITRTSGNATIAKTINVARNETFTITLGTSTYATTMSPVISGITLDTSTATSPIVKIASNASIGTYYETVTVIDSVSAVVQIPLTIIVSPPPSFTAIGNIANDGMVYYADPGNSASYPRTGTTMNDLSGRGLTTNLTKTFSSASVTYVDGSTRTPSYNTTDTCTNPIFVDSPTSSFTFTTNKCSYVNNFPLLETYTVDVWFKSAGSQTAWTPILCTPYYNANDQVNICFFYITGSSVVAGIFDGTNWYNTPYLPSGFSPSVNSWAFASFTWNGSVLTLMMNGDTGTKKSVTISGLTWNKAKLSPALMIGKKWDATQFFNGSVGTIHIYNRVLSDSEISQNYLATKDRYLYPATTNTLYQSAKYGSRYSDTYTVTAGGDTITTTFALASSLGLKWDTSTARSSVLTYSDTLSAGTYYETITATDNLGASSFLPVTINVAKADTLTVSMDTATAVNYNGSPITVYPKPYYKGLVGSDTLTVTTRFSSTLYTDTFTVPTNADTYTVIGSAPVFGFGAASNYTAIVYETSTAVVNKIKQSALNIFMYGGTVGSPFPIITTGGSGTGAVTETLTGLANITGCAISNHFLTSTTLVQGYCEVKATKAADQNYFIESVTAQMYFMTYVANNPTNQSGSGPSIGINEVTPLAVEVGTAPSITGPGAGTYSVGNTITVTGSGFSSGPISVKFWRNKFGTSVNVASDTSLTVIIPSGATTGVIIVTNAYGTAISSFTLTIL